MDEKGGGVMATRRNGKPYIWVTHLAKALGGAKCLWAAWFKAHYKYDKFEEQASDLQKWNRDHERLMTARRRDLEADGWTCYVEDDTAFQLEGATAIVAGKMDLVAIKGDRVLVIDGKTGRERESDVWQVLLYLYALPKSGLKNRPDLPTANIEGEVFYRGGSVDLSSAELTPERIAKIVEVVKAIGSDTPPAKHPSRDECRFCSIGPADCPERVGAPKRTLVGDF